MTVLFSIFTPVVLALFAMQMEKFESFSTRSAAASTAVTEAPGAGGNPDNATGPDIEAED